MTSRPSSFQRLMLRVLRHLVLALDGVLGTRLAALRARLDALPLAHRHRARFAAEIRRLARLRVLLSDPDLLADPGFRGKAAEVARVRNDAGRRAMARRLLYPAPYAGLSGARPEVGYSTEEGRCTGASVAADALPGLARAALLVRVLWGRRLKGGMQRLALTDRARAASLPA